MRGCELKRRKYTRDFKIGVIREVESGKTPAQVSRENRISPSLIAKWRKQYIDDPENAFKGNGRTYRETARIAELERIVGQLYTENEFLKKALTVLEGRVSERGRREEREYGDEVYAHKNALESECRGLLGVSRSGVYKWLWRDGEAVERDIEVRNAIQNVAVEFPAYGYWRIRAELRRRGYTVTVNHKRVLRLMRADNLGGLIHHSDHGVECLKAHKVRISISTRGNPYDNAFVDCFVRTLIWGGVS